MRLAALLLLFVTAFTRIGDAVADTHTTAADTTDADVLLEHALEPWTGDLEGILDRGFIRIATANSPLYFSADGFQEDGMVVAFARELENYLEANHKREGRRTNAILMPMARDQILPAVIEGRADVAFANLTITPERADLVAFTEPSHTGIRELVVTGPTAPPIQSIDDLAETTVHVRRSSSYFQHLTEINEARVAEGKPAIPIKPVDEYLEDFDVLEMMEAELLPATIVDSHKMKVWSKVFENLTVHEDVWVNDGGETAGAVRLGSPELLSAMNGFMGTIRKGTLLGNILIKRYFNDGYVLENVNAREAESRFAETVDIIQRYSDDYAFDWLMITAQGFQESRLDQSKRSHVGAVGIMQVMPRTARDPVVDIPDIETADNNVHAGVRYLRHLHDTYFDDPGITPLDQILLSFAAYNAGPGNIRKARDRATKMGLDPNVWFDNVEIAAGRTISREPVVYVRNIYKYYVAYRLAEEARAAND